MYPILKSYLDYVHKLLLLVPAAFEMNTATSRTFACTTIIIASYCFPSLRSSLLQKMNLLLPSRFHMDPRYVNSIHFQTPAQSACDLFEQDLIGPSKKSVDLSSEVLVIQEPFDDETVDLDSAPPPYIIQPLSDTMQLDPPSDNKCCPSKRSLFSVRKHSFDVVENENPYSTTTSKSILRFQRMLSEDLTIGDQNLCFPFMNLLPFFKLSKATRSRRIESQYLQAVNEYPDFYKWGDLSQDVDISDVDLDWVIQ